MPTISFGGLGNGLDFGQVVDQLVKVAQLPVDRLDLIALVDHDAFEVVVVDAQRLGLADHRPVLGKQILCLLRQARNPLLRFCGNLVDAGFGLHRSVQHLGLSLGLQGGHGQQQANDQQGP